MTAMTRASTAKNIMQTITRVPEDREVVGISLNGHGREHPMNLAA